jgi:hypothetical protein
MARTKKDKIELTDQEAELRLAQGDLADYGRDGEVDSLTKAVQAATDELHKAKGAAPDMGDDEAEEAEDEGEGDEEDEGEGDDEEDMGDDGEGDEGEDEAPAPPPRRPMRRSRASDDAAEQFLKSVLLDDEGAPTAEAEVIEVSDVLTHLTDQFAKSLGDLQQEIGMLQLQLDEALPLLKAMGHHQIQTGQIVKSLRGEVSQLRKSGVGASRPAPGMAYSMSKSMPGAAPKGQGAGLSKSQAAAGLMAAYQTRAISQEQYQRLAPAIDTQGVEAVMGQLPEAVVEQIRLAAASLNGNTNGKH